MLVELFLIFILYICRSDIFNQAVLILIMNLKSQFMSERPRSRQIIAIVTIIIITISVVFIIIIVTIQLLLMRIT